MAGGLSVDYAVVVTHIDKALACATFVLFFSIEKREGKEEKGGRRGKRIMSLLGGLHCRKMVFKPDGNHSRYIFPSCHFRVCMYVCAMYEYVQLIVWYHPPTRKKSKFLARF